MNTRRSYALVIGLLLLVGSLPVFAQGRKVVKYVPKAAGETPRIPAVVNPALPLQTQQAVAAFSAGAVDRAVLPSTLPTIEPSPATLNAPAPTNIPLNIPEVHVFPRTSEQILQKLELFIEVNNRFPSPRAQEPEERFLFSAVNRTIMRAENLQDPIITRLINLKSEYSNRKNPQQIFDELESFIQERGRMPRSTIFRNGRPISRKSCTPQEMGELSLAQAFNHFIQKSTYADLLRFYRTTDGKGDYILEIEEVPDEELVPSVARKVEEIAPAVPSPHTILFRVTEQTKNLIESVREQTALEREKFSPWLESMTQSKNHTQIVNENTLNALSTLSRAINFDQQVHQNRRAVTYLLDTVNNYVGILGERKMDEQKKGYYYKLLYRGQVDPTELPIADNFHVVAEEKGMSWDGKLAPQVEEVKRLHAQAITNGTPFSIYLGRDGDMVTRLGIKYTADLQTVKKDLETTIQHLLPPGYTIRLGMHEIGISGQNSAKFHNGRVHLHLENASASPDDTGLQIDHSISLDIDMRPFAGNRDPHTHKFQVFEDKQIAQNYLALFDKFLDNEAREFLLNLIDSSH